MPSRLVTQPVHQQLNALLREMILKGEPRGWAWGSGGVWECGSAENNVTPCDDLRGSLYRLRSEWYNLDIAGAEQTIRAMRSPTPSGNG